MSRLIPKKQKGKKIFFNQNENTLKEQRTQANQQHKDLANQNWKEGNILKAAYHWWKGTPGLGGQFENDYIVQSGIAPMFGLKGVPTIEAIKKAEAIATGTKAVGTSANVSKTIKNSIAMEKGTQGVVKRLTKSNLTNDPDILNLRQYPQFETPFNRIARKLFMSNDPVKNKEYFKQIGDLVTRFKNGIK